MLRIHLRLERGVVFPVDSPWGEMDTAKRIDISGVSCGSDGAAASSLPCARWKTFSGWILLYVSLLQPVHSVRS